MKESSDTKAKVKKKARVKAVKKAVEHAVGRASSCVPNGRGRGGPR